MGNKSRRKSDGVALKRAVAKAMGYKFEEREDQRGDGEYSALRKDHEVGNFGAGRKCKCCSCTLAESTQGKFCWSCDATIAKWKNFPWDRAEIEKEMAEHCLCFVRSGAKKKESLRGVPKIVASGSYERAVGHREIGRTAKAKRK